MHYRSHVWHVATNPNELSFQAGALLIFRNVYDGEYFQMYDPVDQVEGLVDKRLVFKCDDYGMDDEDPPSEYSASDDEREDQEIIIEGQVSRQSSTSYCYAVNRPLEIMKMEDEADIRVNIVVKSFNAENEDQRYFELVFVYENEMSTDKHVMKSDMECREFLSSYSDILLESHLGKVMLSDRNEMKAETLVSSLELCFRTLTSSTRYATLIELLVFLDERKIVEARYNGQRTCIAVPSRIRYHELVQFLKHALNVDDAEWIKLAYLDEHNMREGIYNEDNMRHAFMYDHVIIDVLKMGDRSIPDPPPTESQTSSPRSSISQSNYSSEKTCVENQNASIFTKRNSGAEKVKNEDGNAFKAFKSFFSRKKPGPVEEVQKDVPVRVVIESDEDEDYSVYQYSEITVEQAVVSDMRTYEGDGYGSRERSTSQYKLKNVGQYDDSSRLAPSTSNLNKASGSSQRGSKSRKLMSSSSKSQSFDTLDRSSRKSHISAPASSLTNIDSEVNNLSDQFRDISTSFVPDVQQALSNNSTVDVVQENSENINSMQPLEEFQLIEVWLNDQQVKFAVDSTIQFQDLTEIIQAKFELDDISDFELFYLHQNNGDKSYINIAGDKRLKKALELYDHLILKLEAI